MFGTIICNKKELTKEELARYQSTYCGLCRAIKSRYGQLERMTVNYDMTFLALFLNGLYEVPVNEDRFRCPVHPLKEQIGYQNKYIDYAADMTIVLSYYKCVDDWLDERKHLQKSYGNILEKHIKQLEEKYPRQTKSVKENLKHFYQLEKSNESSVDEIVNSAGKLLEEVFVFEEDFWSESLRKMGYELGRFIYLMDAAVDYKHDLKKKNFNLLQKANLEPISAEPILIQAIGSATSEFEKLPIVQDSNLLRNILYGGVWQQYYARVRGKGEKNGRRSI